MFQANGKKGVGGGGGGDAEKVDIISSPSPGIACCVHGELLQPMSCTAFFS